MKQDCVRISTMCIVFFTAASALLVATIRLLPILQSLESGPLFHKAIRPFREQFCFASRGFWQFGIANVGKRHHKIGNSLLLSICVTTLDCTKKE